MSQLSAGHDDGPGWYEIRLKGHLDSRWAAWFDGLSITRCDDGTTIIHGPVADQAALHGLVQKTRDLGLPLISVTFAEPGHSQAPDAETQITQQSTKRRPPWPSPSRPRQRKRRRKAPR